MADNEDAYGFNQAFEAAKEEGRREGDEVGYARGRADAAQIMGDPEASGRVEAAAELAGDPGITVERSISLLSKMPKGRETFADMMRGRNPDVGPDSDPQNDADQDRDKRIKQLRAAGAAASKSRR